MPGRILVYKSSEHMQLLKFAPVTLDKFSLAFLQKPYVPVFTNPRMRLVKIYKQRTRGLSSLASIMYRHCKTLKKSQTTSSLPQKVM